MVMRHKLTLIAIVTAGVAEKGDSGDNGLRIIALGTLQRMCVRTVRKIGV